MMVITHKWQVAGSSPAVPTTPLWPLWRYVVSGYRGTVGSNPAGAGAYPANGPGASRARQPGTFFDRHSSIWGMWLNSTGSNPCPGGADAWRLSMAERLARGGCRFDPGHPPPRRY